MGESSLVGPELIYKILEKVHIIRNQLQMAHSRKKTYADHKRRDLNLKKVIRCI